MALVALRVELARAPLVPVAIAFTLGAWSDHTFRVNPFFALLLGAGFLIAFMIAHVGRSERLALVHLLAAVACAACAWTGQFLLVRDDDVAHRLHPRPVPLIARGVLADEPVRTPAPPETDPLRSQPEAASVRVLLRLQTCIGPAGDESLSGKVWLVVYGKVGQPVDELLRGLHTGERIEVSGRLEALDTPGQASDADRAAWSQARGIQGRLRARPEAVIPLGRDPWADWSLGRLRGAAHETLQAQVPASTAGLARALLLGEGAPLRGEDWERYTRTGVVHVLAISGQHLVVLGGVLWWTLRRLGMPQRSVALWVALTLLGYALLTGARPPALRAAVLVAALCLALRLDRGVNLINLVALGWLIVGIVQPHDLAEVGTQLSFWSVAVLTWGVGPLLVPPEPDPLEVVIAESRPWWQRRLIEAGGQLVLAYRANALAWLLITPLVAYHTGGIAPAALLLGPPLALLTSLALIAGFLLLLLAWLPGVATLLALIVHASLGLTDGLVRWMEPWPLFVRVDPIPGWWMIGLLVGLSVWTLRPVRSGWPIVACLGWLVVLLGLWCMPKTSATLVVTFLDVGHGNATLLQLPDGRTILYDAGSLRGPRSARTISDFLTARGISRLDEVIVSHADLDHYNALVGISERIGMGRLLTSATFAQRSMPGVRHTLSHLNRLPRDTLKAGDCLDAGSVTLEVLHPPRGWEHGNENARSLVLLVRHGGHSILLTGDLEQEGLAALLSQPPRRADVLMAPHHGSRRVNLAGLLRWSGAKLVVSSQATPPTETPPAEGVPRWETWREGAVTVTSGAALEAHAFRTGEYRMILPAE
jgi:competence protein ComEC